MLEFVGRDLAFLEATKSHAEWVFSNAFIIHAIPWFLRPLVGNLIWLYGKRVRSQCLRPMMPLIKERLDQFLESQKSASAVFKPPVRIFHS